MSTYVVALTGASGAVYGVRLIEELIAGGNNVELIISPSGFLILREELDIITTDVDAADSILEYIESAKEKREGTGKVGAPSRGFIHKTDKRSVKKLRYIPYEDLSGAPASGSTLRRAMIICPCSMGTLARVATGVSGNLIERAADCVLKERGTLVLVPRETPLNSIQIDNMHKLSVAGAVVLPAMPAFYTRPTTIDDMVDFVVGKILDVLGIKNDLYQRWKTT